MLGRTPMTIFRWFGGIVAKFGRQLRNGAMGAIAIFIVAAASAAWAQGLYAGDVAAALTTADRDEWRQRYEAARATMPDFAVQSVEEFIKINAWRRAFVADGEAVHRFKLRDGEQIVCVAVNSQRALVVAGGDPNVLPPPPEAAPDTAIGGGNGPIPVRDSGLDSSLDEDGAVRECPAGSFPKLIRPVETYYRFRTLQDIFKKRPDDLAPESSGPPHQYTVAADYNTVHTGLQATFNLWHQYVEEHNEFTLVQLWAVNGAGSNLQSAETGLQHCYLIYGNDNTNLFIFSTQDGYNTGYYNLDGGIFVQQDSSVVIGGPLPNYSSFGGTQYAVTLGMVRDAGTGDWWLYVGGKAVGYYPNSLFSPVGLADGASSPQFGGELVDDQTGGIHTSTQMGSGRFPNAGYQYAAFVSQIKYRDANLNWNDDTGLVGDATIPTLWNIGAINDNSGDPAWLVNFYYGGPGNVPDDDDNNANDDDSDAAGADDDLTPHASGGRKPAHHGCGG